LNQETAILTVSSVGTSTMTIYLSIRQDRRRQDKTNKRREDKRRERNKCDNQVTTVLDVHPQQANAIYCIVLYCIFAHTHTHTQRPRHTILTYSTMNGKCILFEITFSETLYLPYFNSILYSSFSAHKGISSSFYFCGV
jgi:hypothetical protein